LIDKNIKNTFMCIGGMGHSISISSGIALVKKNKKIFCLDGDGSFLMHLGASASSAKIKNLVHIVFNNKSHDSVGGHETSAPNLNLRKIAKELGYSQSFTAKDDNEIKRNVIKSIKSKKSFFLEIRCKRGNRSNLSRPKGKIVEYKKKFKSIF